MIPSAAHTALQMQHFQIKIHIPDGWLPAPVFLASGNDLFYVQVAFPAMELAR
jgi:hypothetical protein